MSPRHGVGAARLGRRTGSTLVEQLWVLLITGILLATTVAGGAHLLDAMVVRAGARAVADAFTIARDHALADGVQTAVRLDAPAGRVVVHAETDTLVRLELLRQHGIRIESSRDSMAYGLSGLGFGAANLRVIMRRGASADTVTVSRLGRVKR
jgi:hypothetical protein